MLSIRLLKYFSMAVFIIISFLSHSEAVDAVIKLEAASGEDGFSLKYKIPSMGRGNINLENSGDTDSISIRIMMIEFAEVQLTLNEITSDPDAVNLHYIVSGKLIEEQDAIEGDLSVPFGEFGAKINLNGKKLAPAGKRAIDISLLLTKQKTEYDANVNFEMDFFGFELNFDQELSGFATPSDNLMHEEIINPLDDTVLLDIYVEAEYPTALYTVLNYNIVSGMLTPTENENGQSEEDTPLSGSITLPNGSYHIWCDMDFSTFSPDPF